MSRGLLDSRDHSVSSRPPGAAGDAHPVAPRQHGGMAEVRRLIGVYDADGGLRGELAYVAGKLAGRHCSLCDITHSPVRRRRAWDDYVAGLPVPFELLHRNERSEAVHAATDGHEPCVVADTSDGRVVMVLDSAQLDAAADVNGIAAALDTAFAARGLTWPAAIPTT